MRTLALSCSLTTLICAVGTTALAQDTPSAGTPTAGRTSPPHSSRASNEPPAAIEQVVVTVSKRRELARRVSNSVTAVTGKTLDQRQQLTVQDLVGEVPGLSTESSSKADVRIVLRGLNTGSGGATVASVLDDVPTNPVGAQTNASINTPNFETFDLSRIEVLRGPQSSLYGATAEGGIIKYVTTPPDLTKFSGELEGGVNGIDSGGIGGSTKGWANLPLVPNVVAIRVAAWNDWLPGYVNDPTIGKTDSNSGQEYGYRVSLLVQPTSDLTIRLLAERQSLFTNNADYLQAVGASLTPLTPPVNQLALANGLQNSTLRPQNFQNEAGVYDVSVANDFHFATLTSITSYVFTDYNWHLDDTNVAAGAAGYTLGGLLSPFYPSAIGIFENQNSNTGKFNQEVRLASDPGTGVWGHRLDWLGGFFYTRENSALLEDFTPFNARNRAITYTTPLGSESVRANLAEWAIFGQVDFYILPKLDLTLGGRFEGNTQYSQNQVGEGLITSPPYGFNPATTSNEHDGLYTIAPRWRPTDNTMVYGRIATGFRPGGPNTPVPGAPQVPTSYGPDSVVNYEAGIRQDFLNRKLAVDITGFWVDWRDVQILSIIDTDAGPFGFNGNAGRAQSKGVEWDISWTPFRGLLIEALGDYADARLAASAPGLGASSGQTLPYVPAVSQSVNVDYNWHIGEKVSAFASGSWSFVGTRYTDFSSTPALNESHVKLPVYNTLALRLGLTRGRYDLEFFIKNLTNAQGITFYSSNGGADQTGQVSIIEPRTFGAVARVRF